MNPRREPALLAGVLTAVLSLLVSLHFRGLTSDQAALIVAAITAVGGSVIALFTRPIAPGLATAAIAAVAALFAGFGYHWDPAVVGGVGAVFAAVLAFIARNHVTPVAAVPAATHSRF